MTAVAPSELRRRRQGGLSYIEVLVATMLIALMLVPALEALESGLRATDIHETLTLQHFRAAGGLEELLGEPFSALDAEAQSLGDPTAPTSYSDASGVPMRRLVYLARYDGDDADGDADPFTGGDSGLLWIRVQIEGAGHGFETLLAP